jgi:hypothetical protein
MNKPFDIVRCSGVEGGLCAGCSDGLPHPAIFSSWGYNLAIMCFRYGSVVKLLKVLHNRCAWFLS